jgi:selenoprotein W-related protein
MKSLTLVCLSNQTSTLKVLPKSQMKVSFARVFSCLLPAIIVLHDTVAFSIVGRPVIRQARSNLFTTAQSEDALVADQHSLSIEYCTGCRWMLKSFWLAQELLTTFENDLQAVTIIPSSTKGIFAVKLDGNELLWDRKEQGGFPSPKGLKQIVRDMVRPDKFLGHSDTDDRQSLQESKGLGPISDDAAVPSSTNVDEAPLAGCDFPEPAVVIHYCTGCRWLLRSAYFGQELLTTFSDEIKSVTLVPSKPPAKGGRFVSARTEMPILTL